MDPESAHHAAMLVIRVLGIPPFSWLAAASTASGSGLATSALGTAVRLAFGVAAGFDKDVAARRAVRARASATSRSARVTAIPQDGNPRPRLFRLIPDRAVINRMGFNNTAPRRRPRACAGCAAATTRRSSA